MCSISKEKKKNCTYGVRLVWKLIKNIIFLIKKKAVWGKYNLAPSDFVYFRKIVKRIC